jgi:hypothetical protein
VVADQKELVHNLPYKEVAVVLEEELEEVVADLEEVVAVPLGSQRDQEEVVAVTEPS